MMQERTQNNVYELAYTEMLSKIITKGNVKADRTRTGTTSLFGEQITIDVSNNALPILTARQLFPKSALVEMLWFIKGGTDVSYLKEYNVGIWDEWVIPGTDEWEESDKPTTNKDYFNYVRCKFPDIYRMHTDYMLDNPGSDSNVVLRDLQVLEGVVPTHIKLAGGSIGDGAYGDQWRNWVAPFGGDFNETRVIDQLRVAINMLKNNPDSRRIIISAWNPGYADTLPLPPCHSFLQFYSTENEDGTRNVSLMITCRSQDFVLGTPSNILQYAFLLHLIAMECNMCADKVVWSGGDVHVYKNQLPGIDQFLGQPALNVQPRLVVVNKKDSIFDYEYEDFVIEGYEHGPKITFPIAV